MKVALRASLFTTIDKHFHAQTIRGIFHYKSRVSDVRRIESCHGILQNLLKLQYLLPLLLLGLSAAHVRSQDPVLLRRPLAHRTSRFQDQTEF
jgi:hypothetical protein